MIDTRLPLDWLEQDERILAAAAERLSALGLSLGVDVVHLNTPLFAAWTRFSAPVVGVCHSCTATWWSALRSEPLPKQWKRRAQRLKTAYAACDALIAPSRAFSMATQRIYGAAPHVVYNGAAAPPPAAACRKKRLVVTACRLWDDAKNIAVLDAAASLTRTPVYALGATEGPNGSAISLAHVRSLGPSTPPRVAAWLARAAVFCSVSRYEPFGLSVLEAAQAGCALVLSDIPTFRELWDEAALFVPPDNPAALAAALDDLVEHDAKRLALSNRALARAQRYSRAAMTEGALWAYNTARARFRAARAA